MDTVRKVGWTLFVIMVTVVSLFRPSFAYAEGTESTLPSGISTDDIGQQIEEFIEEHRDTTVGMAVEVFDTQSVLYENYAGYANRENGIVVTEDTVFEWGSATKLLVWVSVMQLYEQGKLALDQDVSIYLPEGFLANLRYDTPVTMTHLMNHTAGFQELYADLFVKEEGAILPLGEALQAHEPAQIYEPGTVTAYSNWGVALAGYIIEQVSGMEFSAYVRSHIFEPLGMQHSGVAADLSDNEWVKEQRNNLACYTTGGKLIPDCFYYITLYPAGMCTSTLSDFAAFAKALLQEDCPLFEQKDTWKQLFTPTDFYGDSQVPLNCHGFWVLPFANLTYGHGGNTAGCSSYLLLDLTKQVGAVVMTNQSGEQVYNTDMMPLIFGEFQADRYLPEQKTPKGMYRSARVVRKGPFKAMSLSFQTIEDEEEMWAAGNQDGIEKVCYAYGDLLKVPTATFGLEMGLFFLWVAAVGFSVISLFVKWIRILVRKIRHKETPQIVLGKWSTGSAFLQLIALGLLVAVIIQVSGYVLYRSYQWMFAGFGLVALGMGLTAAYGIWKIKKYPSTKKRKAYNICVVGLLLVTVVNICYWNLFVFWMV